MSECTQLSLVRISKQPHGLPGKIRRLKIIARFTTKLYTVFNYGLLHRLWIRNCRKLVKYMYVAYKTRIKRSFTELYGLYRGQA